jgi:hypothetical protein
MSSKRVQYSDDTDFSEDKKYMYFKQVPTPHPRKTQDQNLNDDDGSQMMIRIPAIKAKKYRTSKSKKGNTRGLAGRISRRRDGKQSTPDPRGTKSGVDGRATDAERRRKSEVARSLPRRSDGKFARRTPGRQRSNSESSNEGSFLETTGVDGRGTGSERRRKSEVAKSIPRRSDGKFAKQTPKRQERESSDEESFLDTTMPQMPYSKLIKLIFQTPGFKKALAAAKYQESDGEESFLDGPRPNKSALKKKFGTPQKLNFDESDDE